MSARQFASTVVTAVVTICVALAVPVSQLCVRAEVTTCCCPDPAKCRCPDHKPAPEDGAAIQACHKAQQDVASICPPAFAVPSVAAAYAAPHVVTVATIHVEPEPKTPLDPDPEGPS